MHQKILILDFGSQVTQLIARRIREAHVFCEVVPYDVSNDWLRKYAADGLLKGIILSGSHASTYEEHDLRAPHDAFEMGIPVLGICYGMFTMAVQLGGRVAPSAKREFGHADVRAHGHTELLNGLQDYATAMGHGMLQVWMSHGDKVTEMPPGFKLMASTDSCPIAGMADEERRFYGVQFTRRSPTPAAARRSWSGSSSTSAARAPTGSWATTSLRRWSGSAPRSAARR